MRTLLNFRPMLFGAVSLIVGLVAVFNFLVGSVIVASILLEVFALSLIAWIVVVAIKKLSLKSTLLFALVFLLIFGLGFGVLYSNYVKFNDAKIGSVNCSGTGYVVEVAPTDYGYCLVLDGVEINNGEVKRLNFLTKLYVSGETEFRLGNKVEFTAIMSDVNDNFEGDFQVYNYAQGVRYKASVNEDKITIIADEPNVFQRINLMFRDTLKAGLDENEFTIAYALMCGNSEWMDSEVLSSYRDAGVAHIFAVSGLHIGFMAVIFNFIFKKLRIKGYLRALLVTIVLFFYSGVCGFGASSLRACIMSATMLFASASGKKYDALSSISLSAIIVLLISPFQLFTAGFQLSFGISAGIILLTNPMTKLLKFLPNKIAGTLSVSIVAFIVGVPIMIANFNSMALVSILANFVLVPVVSVLFTLLFVFTIISAATTLPTIFLFIPNYLIKGINYLITAFDYEALIITGITLGGWIIPFIIAEIIIGFANFKRIIKIVSCSILFVIFIVGAIVYNVKIDKSFRSYVIGAESFQATLISADDEDFLVINYAVKDFNTSRLERAMRKLEITHLDKLIILRNGDDIKFAEITLSVRKAVLVDEIYYCADYDDTQFKMYNQLFTDMKFINVEVDGTIPFNNIDCEIIAGGYACKISKGNRSLVAVSDISRSPIAKYMLQGVTCDYLVCANNLIEIKSAIIHNEFISYLPNGEYKNAQENGNYPINFG